MEQIKSISIFVVILPFLFGFSEVPQNRPESDEVIEISTSTLKTPKTVRSENSVGSMEVYDWDTAQIVQLPPILQKIAECESSGRHTDENGEVIKGVINSFDTGLFQINELYHGEAAKEMGLDIFTLAGNVKYALHLFETQGTQPWSASAKCWN